MSPDILVLRRWASSFLLRLASIATASGVIPDADIYKNIVFLKLRSANIVLAFQNRRKSSLGEVGLQRRYLSMDGHTRRFFSRKKNSGRGRKPKLY
jgi:hypothetical protein